MHDVHGARLRQERINERAGNHASAIRAQLLAAVIAVPATTAAPALAAVPATVNAAQQEHRSTVAARAFTGPAPELLTDPAWDGTAVAGW
ncbi:hypothetical protein [Prescottella sp. R16]|uniref:hypothetical protein n=1 Tax=Prescottella sp. R16 TaxID=3064529 RepID=UPI00272EE55E|nr:hypothetical protein [Prescottella sp. R16]